MHVPTPLYIAAALIVLGLALQPAAPTAPRPTVFGGILQRVDFVPASVQLSPEARKPLGAQEVTPEALFAAVKLDLARFVVRLAPGPYIIEKEATLPSVMLYLRSDPAWRVAFEPNGEAAFFARHSGTGLVLYVECFPKAPGVLGALVYLVAVPTNSVPVAFP